ncbi:MAG: Guanine nucleotide exchange factor lte1 [Thelocarpon impressellum]|nr:MAG: Guanine nucleotide exchange factor lte1 [Thelocarpon impressellum]
MATVAVEGMHGLGPAGSLPAAMTSKPGPRNAPAEPQPPKRHDRQPSLRKANSVELTHRRMNSSGNGNAQVAPDGASGGREGRQFTVGNVGTNGMIFLRPMIRPAAQRAPPPAFVFPSSPADGTGSQAGTRRRSGDVVPPSSQSGIATPRSPRSPRTPIRRVQRCPTDQASAGLGSPPAMPHAQRQHRAHSFSTLKEKAQSRDGEAGGVRVVIKPAERHRPRTAEQLSSPMLEVAIPNHRLGSPRFSARGTAILRSSVYTRTSTADGMRSSAFSDSEYEQIFARPPAVPNPQGLGPCPLASKARPRSRGPHRMAGPFDRRLYDDLTFHPTSDDPAIVRYSPVNGSIVAATPPRLIAQITSPNFLDYDLLSDFFLTFRSFMTAQDLLTYLMARLRWAVDRHDDVGKIVKVRTFVAVRHWVLNYFVDDFVPDLRLREQFCDSVRDLCDALRRKQDGGASDFKLVGELKKCWRRTCDLYWDGPAVADDVGAYEDIRPGGPAGSRDDQSSQVGHPPVDSVLARADARPSPDAPSVPPLAGAGQLPRTPETKSSTAAMKGQNSTTAQRVISASSESSVQAMSCSIPTKGFRRIEAVLAGSSGGHAIAHPVAINPKLSTSQPSASTASLFPNRPRVAYMRRRSGSFSNVGQDDRAPVPPPKPAAEAARKPLADAPAGSLIRGNLVPPTPALVVSDASTQDQPCRLVAFPNDAELDADVEHKPAVVSGPGMRRLLGSVRRALGNKNGWALDANGFGGSSTQSSADHQMTRYITAKVHPRQVAPVGNASPRVDLLHERILEAFRVGAGEKARTADMAAILADKAAAPRPGGHRSPEPTKPRAPEADRSSRHQVISMVTMGSKSIVIMDDTRPPPLPATMSGGLGQLLPEHGARPEVPLDELRRGQNIEPSVKDKTDSLAAEPGPPRSLSLARSESQLGRDGASANVATPPPQTATTGAPSTRSIGKSFKSTGSMSLRKFASFQGTSIHETLRSFDATTLTPSDVDSGNDYFNRPPGRMLRRRPGGDLRAARKITDLEPIARPRSAGSLTTRSGSISSSILRTSGSVAGFTESEYGREHRRRFSLGALAEVRDERQLSLMRTHSSQPNLRPSFEAEVAKLARLPDADEDGGIESTLLKLEGRFERRGSDESPLDYALPKSTLSMAARSAVVAAADPDEMAEHRHEHVPNVDADATSARPDEVTEAGRGIRGAHHPTIQIMSSLDDTAHRHAVPASPSILSEESYSSIPLLERGLSERSLRSHAGSSSPTPRASLSNRQDFARMFDGAELKARARGLAPSARDEAHESFLLDDDDQDDSFLLDEDEDFSDLSSELSVEVLSCLDVKSPNAHTLSPVAPGTIVSEIGFSSHPLRHPPSPPLTAEQAMSMSTVAKPGRFQNLPLTPESSPVDRAMAKAFDLDFRLSEQAKTRGSDGGNGGNGGRNGGPPRQAAVHMPFILSYDPELLAQQFTLCEKDALSEVDWRELVDLRWRQTLPAVQNWVEYLRTQDPRGVELVIARFNVVVKWALSEIVMTRDIHERARTISCYIQVAVHARRYRNYATMYQIAVAVLSTDCARLTNTWALVSTADVRALAELEVLIQPVRNFHNLRVEMETATAEEGCIPFMGIYTHDLVFNSHRPSRVAGAGGGEDLVNFERHRTTAAVVKNLLRLLDGSTKYSFAPVEGVIDRCLWLAALPDAEIRALSKEIQ